MSDTDDVSELLFFDTFSHEEVNDFNLDLVQFPKPVYISQIRIIPLGARVQADFPGGVRLGATNPSQFDIEFFVNDLGIPGASTFEHFGELQYNQNDCIHLACVDNVLTDGLILRGWYSTITLAVYGITQKTVNHPIASPSVVCELSKSVPDELCNVLLKDDLKNDEWQDSIPNDDLVQKPSTSNYDPEDMDYDLSHDHFHQQSDDDNEHDSRHLRRSPRSAEPLSSPLRARKHSESSDKEYMRSRDKSSRDWSRSPEYTGRHSSSRRKRSDRSRSDRSRSDPDDTIKWPRTPPTVSIDSPARPRSPDTEMEFEEKPVSINQNAADSQNFEDTTKLESTVNEMPPAPPNEDDFELIVSDDDIMGDDELALNEKKEKEQAEAAAIAEYERQIDAAAKNAPPAIVEFDPTIHELLRYETNLLSLLTKDIESLRITFKKITSQIKWQNVAAFRDTTQISEEEREQFVLLVEQFHLTLSNFMKSYRDRNIIFQHFFKSNEKYLHQASNILQIALDMDIAYLQPKPLFKIRHHKAGTYLAELLCWNEEFISYIVEKTEFNLFKVMFKPFSETHMAESIRLQLLKVIYTALDTKTGVRNFLNPNINGYQWLYQMILSTKNSRTKFFTQAIIRKLHLFEALDSIKEQCANLYVFQNYQRTEETLERTFKNIEYAFGMIIDALEKSTLLYMQPRRFIPVSRKFEHTLDFESKRNFEYGMRSYFNHMQLADSLLILLSNGHYLPATTYVSCLDLVQALLKTNAGICYLVEDEFQLTKLILAVLTNSGVPPINKESPPSKQIRAVTPPRPMNIPTNIGMMPGAPIGCTPIKPSKYTSMEALGLEMAYKVQSRFYLDAIHYISNSNDYDSIKLADYLHKLFSLTCTGKSRRHVVEFLGTTRHMQIFVDLIKKEQRLQAQHLLSSPGTKYKSPVLSYAVDLFDCVIRHCEQLEYLSEHQNFILPLAKNHESFEPSVSAVLQEMYIYLKPLEAGDVFKYHDISPLVEAIKRSIEYITTFPGDLIMGLRILQNLCIPKNVTSFTKELKYRYVVLQFHGLDGVGIILEIFEKLCDHFEQPGLHSALLTTTQGTYINQILLPALLILKEMLSYAIECVGNDYNDLTPIEYLMRVHILLYYYPNKSVTEEIEHAKQVIIQILLAFTQPKEEDEDSVHKSLWTKMISELLKSIRGPATFTPGLQLFAELLPLTLPMPLPPSHILKEKQQQLLITQRKLWSAHLHPKSAEISKLIETLAPSGFPQLSELLQRVCMQLSDLAPNMSLLIAKSISELLCTEWQNTNGKPTSQMARLLNFSARLCAFAPLKISLISILPGKFWDIFQSILAHKGTGERGEVTRCHMAVHRILESFLDPQISLVKHDTKVPPAVNLASAIPPKDLLPIIVEAIMVNLLNTDITSEVVLVAIRNMVILTEQDITFYHLLQVLKSKSNEFYNFVQKVVIYNETQAFNQNLQYVILILRALCFGGKHTCPALPQRTLKLNGLELAELIHWNLSTIADGTTTTTMTDSQPHLLQRALVAMDNYKAVSNKGARNDLVEVIKLLNDTAAANATAIANAELAGDSNSAINFEEDATTSGSNSNSTNTMHLNAEPYLPQAEGIVTQYDARPIFTRYQGDPLDIKLTAHYWLNPLPIEIVERFDEPLYERITCDLNEMGGYSLAKGEELTNDCKRVLHLSSSPQSNRERTPTAPCFRARRVEVDPNVGRPEKKIFINNQRGGPRGYGRPSPQRSDLFRSRPPNTSRPPSLHVDDFLALETCGAQPTGPTGYNKLPHMMRTTRVGRTRAMRLPPNLPYRQKKMVRTGSPSGWVEIAGPGIYRVDPHFSGHEMMHFGALPHYNIRPPRARGGRSRAYMR